MFKQSSTHWKLLQATDSDFSLTEKVNKVFNDDVYPRCFPFNEGFPNTPWFGDSIHFYIVVTSDDWKNFVELEATIDDSRQYMSEGLEWKLKKPNDRYTGNIERGSVVAWYQK